MYIYCNVFGHAPNDVKTFRVQQINYCDCECFIMEQWIDESLRTLKLTFRANMYDEIEQTSRLHRQSDTILPLMARLSLECDICIQR